MSTPLVFDRSLVRRRLARALHQGYADFLLARTVEDLEERLSTVLREFPLALDVGTPTPAAAEALRRSGRAGTVVRLSLVPEPGSILGDEEHLPFSGERFDLAVSLLSLHSVNDLPGSLIQIRRALKPDGLFIGALLGGSTLTELRQSLTQAESELEGGVSPRVAPFADLRDIGGLLQRAGFALPVTDSDVVRVRYANAFALMRDLRRMGLTNALNDRCGAPRSCGRPRSMRSVSVSRTDGSRRPSRSSGSQAGPRMKASRSRCAPVRPRCGLPMPWA
jgi:SAM-dependent methyltransferase